MEIVTEITSEEYRAFVKSYFLEKDWTKRVAILVIAAVVISMYETFSLHGAWNHWIFFHSIFSGFFCVFALIFFVAPYAFAYNNVRMRLKKEADHTGILIYEITDEGITVIKNGVSSFCPWEDIHKVKVFAHFIVFIMSNEDMMFFPVISLPNADSESFLQLINGYKASRTALTREKHID